MSECGDCRDHTDGCADCLEERKAAAGIGAGIVSAARRDVIQMDQCVLEQSEVVEACAALEQTEVIRSSSGNFTRSWTAADGHCLYRSVSEHITGGQAAFSQMRWAAAGWLKDHWEQMKPSYQLSKKKVLNAVKFGAAEHMKKGTIRQVPAWAWGGEQEIVALAETFGVVIMVHCSRNGTVHRYDEQGDERWLYFDQVRENYEAMHRVDGIRTPLDSI